MKCQLKRTLPVVLLCLCATQALAQDRRDPTQSSSREQLATAPQQRLPIEREGRPVAAATNVAVEDAVSHGDGSSTGYARDFAAEADAQVDVLLGVLPAGASR